MAQELKSPKQNVAQKEIIAVQNASTKIKEIIVADVDANVSKEETTKKIAKIIDELKNDITDPILLKESRQSIALSTQRWYYEYSQNVKAIRVATTQNINYAIARFKTPQLALKGKVFNIDLQSFMSELTGIKSNNEFKNVVDKFRPFIDDATKGLPIISDYDKLVKGQVKVLASNPPISNRVSKDGKPYKINLRNRAEMFVRYEANKEDLQRLIADGVEYAWISTHADASPRCSPYQGKLYSLKNESGVINGNRYSPIEDALKGQLGDGNGCISGYNCRHRLIEYTPNSKAPNDYTEAEMKKAYEIDRKQRAYENRIRQLKTEERLMRASGDTETAKKLRLQWKKLNKDYEIYSLDNGRAYYNWRTIIREDEVNS